MSLTKNNKLHPHLGIMSKHHLIPRQRLKKFYGKGFVMKNNILRLWRFRHDAWHILFRQMTLNETITYLRQKKANAYGYNTVVWRVLFHDLTHAEAVRLLTRVGNIIRKKDSFVEFDATHSNRSKTCPKKKPKHGSKKKSYGHLRVA